jgi:hypothetical protein
MLRLLLLCCAAWLSAGEAPDPAAAYQQAVDAAHGAYQQAVETAGKAYGSSVGKARETCITALVGIARRESRKEDRSGATAAWSEVLRLRPDHPDANAYVDLLPREQGEAIRAALGAQPAAAGDLLGDGPGAPTAHPATTADVARYRETEARERTAFAKVEATARSRFLDAEGKAKARALSAFGTMAERAVRAGDLPAAAAAWKQALTMQRDHPPAIAFFDRIGTTAETIASLPEPIVPLGPAPDPAVFIDGSGPTAAPASLRGAKIAMIGSGEGSPLQTAISDRLTKAGASVSLIEHNRMMEYERAEPMPQLAEASLILALTVADSSRPGLVSLMRETKAPVVCTDITTFHRLGMSSGISYNGHHRSAGGDLEPVPGLRHPIITGLPASFPWQMPAKPGAAPAISDGFWMSYGVTLPEGVGTVVLRPAGKPTFITVVAYEAGSPMVNPPGPQPQASAAARTSARRVGFLLFADGALRRDQMAVDRLSPQVWRTWDASLVWARGR